MNPFTQAIEADEIKVIDYRAEIRHHELRIASIRRAIESIQSRLLRLRAKSKEV
jgi:hypothetical protein